MCKILPENFVEDSSMEIRTCNKIPFLKLMANGDIFVKGKFYTNDIEVFNGLREFLKQEGFIK